MAACYRHMRCMFHNHTRQPRLVFYGRGVHTHTRPHISLSPLAVSIHPAWPSAVLHKLPHQQRLLASNVGSQWFVCAAVPVRHASVTPHIPPPPPTLAEAGYIPDAPPIPEPMADTAINALGETTLASLGLCNNTPAGLVQSLLEWVHVGTGLPWWTSIVIGTVFLRLMVFPLVILAQRNSAKMQNTMPILTRLQDKMTKARMSGNALEAARVGAELTDLMKREGVNPVKNMLVPLAQAPIFISVFVGLRQMANLPVESLTTGGLLWFPDLTIPDPFFLLPALTMATFFITIELGVDGINTSTSGHATKYFLRAMPLIMLPFIINFPTAMCCYWFTSNVVSLSQVLFLRIPGIKPFFKIPPMVKHDQSALPKKMKMIEGFRETMNNSRLMAEAQDRQRMEAMQFKKAGEGPLEKTYSYNPTKLKKNKKKT